MRRTLTLALVVFAGLFACLALTGCNTVEGVGEDVTAVGSGVSEAASETGKAISGEK